MPANAEQIADVAVDGEEASRLSRRLELTHLVLVRETGQNLGVGLSVITAGEISIGDPVELVGADE